MYTLPETNSILHYSSLRLFGLNKHSFWRFIMHCLVSWNLGFGGLLEFSCLKVLPIEGISNHWYIRSYGIPRGVCNSEWHCYLELMALWQSCKCLPNMQCLRYYRYTCCSFPVSLLFFFFLVLFNLCVASQILVLIKALSELYIIFIRNFTKCTIFIWYIRFIG
jgi:hypothetical protein